MNRRGAVGAGAREGKIVSSTYTVMCNSMKQNGEWFVFLIIIVEPFFPKFFVLKYSLELSYNIKLKK